MRRCDASLMRSRFHPFTLLRFHAFTLSRLHPFTLLRFHASTLSRFHAFTHSLITHHLLRITVIYALCSLTVLTFGADISAGEKTALKKVTIREQPGSTRDIVKGKAGKSFLVEVIKDMQGLKKGLSQRKSMPEENGMLFVLDIAQEHAFWMKGMKFPLDIIFIGPDMQITEILEDLQPCEKCPVYFPMKRPAYALELNAGLARKHRLSVGDTLVIEK
ncbi:MAG: DUF192 domain-containing protein [Nitrospirae bacterium]|nr:DUF192 domain-containing protein [Nitrospirota bacterium]